MRELQMNRIALASTLILALGACTGGDEGAIPGDAGDTSPFAEIAEDDVVRMVGTEPFWNVRIEDGQLTYSSPELLDGETIEIERFAGRGGVSYSGQFQGAQIDITVSPGDCSDGMSEHEYPYTATVSLGEEQLQGCAWRDGEDDIGSPEVQDESADGALT